MTAVPVRQIRIPDELYVFSEIAVSCGICHAEDFTQWSDPVCFKHFNVCAPGYAVFDFTVGYIELIIEDAAVLHAFAVI